MQARMEQELRGGNWGRAGTPRVEVAGPFLILTWQVDAAPLPVRNWPASDCRGLILRMDTVTAWDEELRCRLAEIARAARRESREVKLIRADAAPVGTVDSLLGIGGVQHAATLSAATAGWLTTGSRDLSVVLQSRPENVDRARTLALRFAQDCGCAPGRAGDVSTATTEVVANAVTHGSPEGARQHLQLSFHREGRLLLVDVRDWGAGFDARTRDGRGMRLVRALTDRLEVFADDGRTLVRMGFALPGEPGPSAVH